MSFCSLSFSGLLGKSAQPVGDIETGKIDQQPPTSKPSSPTSNFWGTLTKKNTEALPTTTVPPAYANSGALTSTKPLTTVSIIPSSLPLENPTQGEGMV